MTYTGAVPDTVARPWDWQARSLCRTADADVFFAPQRQGEARRTCYACPVIRDCQSWVTSRERGISLAQRDDAIIAGLTPAERLALDPTVPTPPPEEPSPTGPKHGTRSCYRAGCRRDECKAANRAYQQERKLRQQEAGESARKPATSPVCGTVQAYRRHRRRKEPIDDACRKAYAQDRAARTARQRNAAVYTLWSKGLPDSEIAAQLGIGTRAVRNARERLGLIANVPTGGAT